MATTKVIITAEIVSIDDQGKKATKSKSTTTTDFKDLIALDIKAEAKNEDSAISVTNR